MKPEKPTFLDWLCLNDEIDFSQARWLGAFFGALSIFAALAILAIGIVGLLHLLGAFFGIGRFATDTNAEAIRNIGLVLVATFGAPFLVWRAIVAQKQVDVAEQGQITDRINESVQGLGSEKITKEITETPRYQKNGDEWERDDDGNLVSAKRPDGLPIIDREILERTSPNLEVRIGAIYALERIAQDSDRDHLQVMEILCAYVRENAPVGSLEPSSPPFNRAKPRTDIQAAITVLGRRSRKQIDLEWSQNFRMDLRDTDLSGVDFRFGDYSAAIFNGCRLEAALFDKSKLHGTIFARALLNWSSFFEAELRGTRFDHAVINRPYAKAGGMSESINAGIICGISLVGTDLTALDYLGEPNVTNRTFGSRDTKLSHYLDFDRNVYQERLREIRRLRKEGDDDLADAKESDLYKNGFVDWVPYDSSDMAIGFSYQKLLDRLGLTDWPYQ